jgi:hypothetical protein
VCPLVPSAWLDGEVRSARFAAAMAIGHRIGGVPFGLKSVTQKSRWNVDDGTGNHKRHSTVPWFAVRSSTN